MTGCRVRSAFPDRRGGSDRLHLLGHHGGQGGEDDEDEQLLHVPDCREPNRDVPGGFRRPEDLGRQCLTTGDAAWTWPEPRSVGSAHGSG